MIITVQIEVPDGEYCRGGLENCYWHDSVCGIFKESLQRDEFFPSASLKCNPCKEACERAKGLQPI